MAAQAVHCPAADQILHRPLVQLPIVHALQEVLQRTEGAALPALGSHAADKPSADVFHSPKAETNAPLLYGEMVLGVVDIRRQQGNAQLRHSAI